MFTPDERARLRDALVSVAGSDPRISGAALTGSSAAGGEDRWSDIDLALAVADDADVGQAIADWTDRMYREHGAIHHVDVTRGAAVYRVFLLASTLQVDLAFSPAAECGAIRRAFGVAVEALLVEIARADAGLAHRLAGPLRGLAGRQAPSPDVEAR